jgi:Flp pilus assembly protein TadG
MKRSTIGVLQNQRSEQRRDRQHGRRGERGQALVIWALMATVMLGFVGLVVDGSNLQENKRQLRNAADAAAMAGAYDLPSPSGSQAQTDSVQWLTKNGSGSTEVVSNQPSMSSGSAMYDTMTVSLQRNVPYWFAQLFGNGSSHNVTATAKVQVATVTGLSTADFAYMPYAIFYEDLQAHPHGVGDIVPFRSDAWVSENISANNPAWNSNSNSFKGYSPAAGGVVSTGDTIVAGTGNRCGQEPISQLQHIYNTPPYEITIVVIDSGTGNGRNLDVHVIGFVTLDIRNVSPRTQSINQGCGQGDFIGKIVGYPTSRGITGGTQSPAYASCGTGFGACKAVLTK